MLCVDKAHAELIMYIDPGAGEAFKAQTLVSQLNKQVNTAVTVLQISGYMQQQNQ